MPYSVKGFFEINEDMVQILLMLEVLFTQDSKVEDLFCGASSGSEPSLFFSNYFFSLGFKPIQDDFQHGFARMTDEADSSVVLAELQVALFRECNNHHIRLDRFGIRFKKSKYLLSLTLYIVNFFLCKTGYHSCCIVVLLFYVHGKHLMSCRDGQLT